MKFLWRKRDGAYYGSDEEEEWDSDESDEKCQNPCH